MFEHQFESPDHTCLQNFIVLNMTYDSFNKNSLTLGVVHMLRYAIRGALRLGLRGGGESRARRGKGGDVKRGVRRGDGKRG